MKRELDMKQPSKEWREQIAPDEAAHHVRVAKVIGDLQRARSRKFGQGRALHRKQLLGATGTLEVLDGLPTTPGTACSPSPAVIARWYACPTAGRISRPTACPTSAASP